MYLIWNLIASSRVKLEDAKSSSELCSVARHVDVLMIKSLSKKRKKEKKEKLAFCKGTTLIRVSGLELNSRLHHREKLQTEITSLKNPNLIHGCFRKHVREVAQRYLDQLINCPIVELNFQIDY